MNKRLKKKKKASTALDTKTLVFHCKYLSLGAGRTICSHQETKHTLPYLWFLKGAVCLHMSKAYLADSTSEEGDLGNKALLSATYAETPLPAVTSQRHWAQSQSQRGWVGSAFPMVRSNSSLSAAPSNSPRQPEAAASTEPVSMPV